MEIFSDFCKIKRRLCRQENIFGYKTTLANQLYSFYCILGIERYFTDKFHLSTKLLFFTWHFVGMVIPFLMLFEYILFLEKNDLILLLHVLFMVVCCFFYRIFVPFLFYWYADDFKKILNEVDLKIWDKRSNISKLSNVFDLKSTALNHLIWFGTSQTVFALITTFDVLIFYDEKKLKDYSYYVFPLPKIEQYGNMWIFLSVSGCSITTVIAFTFEICLLCGIPLILISICHNEVQLICYTFKQHYINFINGFESMINGYPASFQLQKEIQSLRNTLIIGVRRYQRVVKIIKYLKGFYTTLSLISLQALFIFSVSQFYAILTMNGAYVLKLREIAILVSTTHLMYYFCHIGDTLQELATIMSFEVYSMPWYCSTAIRKDVWLFLCQSQHEMNLKAAKVFPLSLTSFLRLLNSVYSTANVLRRVTS